MATVIVPYRRPLCNVTFFPPNRYSRCVTEQQPTIPELVVRAQSGNHQAFSDLYEQFARPLYGFILLRTKHRETAEDLVSQTWFKAWRSIARCTPERFPGWLYTIARRLIIDHYRTSRPEISWDQLPGYDAGTDLAHDTAVRNAYDTIKEQLAVLTPEQREVVILRLWDDLSFDDIAAILGKSPTSCRMLMSRGIKTLRSLSPAFTLFIILYANLHR